MTAKHAILAGFLIGLTSPAAAQSPASAPAQSLPPPGASSCSGCHAPARLNSPVVPIRAREAKDIVQAMQEFRSGQRAATVMDRLAKGFSDEETQAIAAWLAAQR